MDKQQVEERIVEVLRTVYDPEIPANIYDLGLIYRVNYNPNDSSLDIDMTLTAPGCPLADFIMEDVRQKVLSVWQSSRSRTLRISAIVLQVFRSHSFQHS